MTINNYHRSDGVYDDEAITIFVLFRQAGGNRMRREIVSKTSTYTILQHDTYNDTRATICSTHNYYARRFLKAIRNYSLSRCRLTLFCLNKYTRHGRPVATISSDRQNTEARVRVLTPVIFSAKTKMNTIVLFAVAIALLAGHSSVSVILLMRYIIIIMFYSVSFSTGIANVIVNFNAINFSSNASGLAIL